MTGMTEAGTPTDKRVVLDVEELSISYGSKSALRDASFSVYENEIFGIIGPANSGKTSLLKAINRMDLVTSGMKVDGHVRFLGREVRKWKNVFALRRMIGVVFPLPVGLPLSIYDNVSLAPKLAGVSKKSELDDIVERCLTRAALWEEVKDRLKDSAMALSGGQQQRLCIARALATRPNFMLLDEPFAGIDPIAVGDIQDLVRHLTERGIGVLITDHNVRETLSLIDRAYIIYDGQVLTQGKPEEIIANEDVRRVYLGDMFG